MFRRSSLLSPGLWSRGARLSPALPAIVLAGCIGTGLAGNPMDPGAREAQEIELLVRNNHFHQATVYTSPDHGSKRLGVVSGLGKATFKFRWHLPYIQLRIKFLAGSEVLTESLAVEPDDLLELIIPAM